MCKKTRTCSDCGKTGHDFYPGFEFEFYTPRNVRCYRCPDCHEQSVRLYARCTYGGFSSGFGDRRILNPLHFGYGRCVSEFSRSSIRGAA